MVSNNCYYSTCTFSSAAGAPGSLQVLHKKMSMSLHGTQVKLMDSYELQGSLVFRFQCMKYTWGGRVEMRLLLYHGNMLLQ